MKDAVRSARKESEASLEFQLESPATAERIRHTFSLRSITIIILIGFLGMIPLHLIFSRLACEDELMQKVAKLPEEGTYRPWGIQV